MKIIERVIDSAIYLPSPHYNSRPIGYEISLLVIHCISLPPKQFNNNFVEQFFLGKLTKENFDDPYYEHIKNLQVSAHCYIKRDGQLIQFVPFDKRAWHAGQSEFKGISNCNNYSIGIELEGNEALSYTQEQYQQLARVTRLLQVHYPAITQDRIVGHAHIAPGRKTDPGPLFDWAGYYALLS